MKFTKRNIESSGSGGPGRYLQFKDGESKVLFLKGDVHEFHIKWVNGKSVATGPTDPEAKSRFKVNAITMEDNKLVAKIWEISTTVYNALADVNVEYPLETIALKVTRQGVGTDTSYHVLPLLKQQRPNSVEKVELHAFGAPKMPEPDFGPPPSFDEHSEIPF